MNLERRIWILIGKKLAGEATESEKTELEELAQQNPDLQFYMEVMSDWWYIAEHKGQKEASLAFNKHLDQMISRNSGRRPTYVSDTTNKHKSRKRKAVQNKVMIRLRNMINKLKTVVKWVFRLSL